MNMNINQLMKQAQTMQKKMLEAQEKIASTEYEGISGGSLVQVKINGKHDILNLKIDVSLMNKDEVEILEDLIIAAYKDAKKKAEEDAEGEMSSTFGNMGMPSGFKLPF